MGVVIIPRCETDTATITSSPAATLSADNLQVSARGLIYRVVASSATLTVTLAAPALLGGVVLWRHNLLTTGTWRVRFYEGATGTGTLLHDSGTQDALQPKSLDDLEWGLDPLGAAIADADFSYYTADKDYIIQSLVIDVADPSLSEIDISRLFAGPLVKPILPYSLPATLQWARDTIRTRTASGGLRVEESARRRVMNLPFGAIEDAERAGWRKILDSGSGSEIWVSARAGVGGSQELDYAILGYLTDDPDMVRNEHARFEVTLNIEES